MDKKKLIIFAVVILAIVIALMVLLCELSVAQSDATIDYGSRKGQGSPGILSQGAGTQRHLYRDRMAQ